MSTKYRYWVDQGGSYLLCRQPVKGGNTEYAASKGKYDWRTDSTDSDVVMFVSEESARQEAGNRGINPADVR
jgi:hypothetical protein